MALGPCAVEITSFTIPPVNVAKFLVLRRARLITRAKIGRNSWLRQPRAEKSGQVLMAFLFERGAKIGIAVLLSTESINHVSDGVDKIFAAALVFEGYEKKSDLGLSNLSLVEGISGLQTDDRLFDCLHRVPRLQCTKKKSLLVLSPAGFVSKAA